MPDDIKRGLNPEVKDEINGKAEEKASAQGIIELLQGTCDEERHRLQAIFDMLPCYVALLDSQHRVRFYNKAYKDLFGLSSCYCYEAMQKLKAPCQSCLAFDAWGRSQSCVTEWVHPDKKDAFRSYSYPFSDVTGEKLLLQVGFSIGSNLRVRQALDLSESSFRTVTDNLSIGIAVVALDLSIIGGNARMEQWLSESFKRGRNLCQVLRCNGKHALPLIAGEYCPDCPFGLALRDRASHEKQVTVHFKSLGRRTVRLVACPIVDHRGRVRAMASMLEDITKRLAVDKRLERMRELETIGTLAGGIAHEINQPLSALNLYTSGLQILLEKADSVDKGTINERLGLIMRESEKIRAIIANMRTLVMKGESAILEAVKVEPVCYDAIKTVQKQLDERKIQIEVEIPETLPLVISQRVQLEQVLVNLLSNAVHAIDAVGEADKRLIKIVGEYSQSADKVVLTIADSGVGLPQDSGRITDPFYSASRVQGMGLGLTIVSGFITQWGGELSAKARNGLLEGACFYMSLKVAEGKEDGDLASFSAT